MDHEPDTVRVRSPFARPREPSIVVAVIVAFLLLALLKPWSFGDNGSNAGQARPQAAIPSSRAGAIAEEPSPTATPSIPDPNAMACLSDLTEQVVILERWAGHEVRSWIAAADMTTSGPLDERLVPIPIFSAHVIGLGICAPRVGSDVEQHAARLLDVQAIVTTTGGSVAEDLGLPNPITVQMRGADPALLYGSPGQAPVMRLPGASIGATQQPQPTSAADTGAPVPNDDWAAWPPGAYAVAFLFPSDGPSVVRWLRIDLIEGAGSAN